MVNPAVQPKAAPYEMTSTEVKSNMMDMLDDARAGYVSFITRNGRPAAAVVPVAVGRAYESQASLPDHVRSEIEAAVDRARAEITAVLTRLDDQVRGGQPSTPADQADEDTPTGPTAPIADPQLDPVVRTPPGDVTNNDGELLRSPGEHGLRQLEHAPVDVGVDSQSNTEPATQADEDNALLAALQEQICSAWVFDVIQWTRIQAGADRHGVTLKSREHLHRKLRKLLGEGVPEQVKRDNTWSYPTVELWAAINDALARNGQPITYYLPYPEVRDFVNLLPTLLTACEGLEAAPRRDELATRMREAGARVPKPTLPRLHWLAKHRQQSVHHWLDALSQRDTTAPRPNDH